MQRWLERIGFALQWVEDELGAAVHEAAAPVRELAEDAGDALPEEAAGPLGAATGTLASAGASWLAVRLLGERDVHWARAVLAGIVGTLLYDAVMVADQRLLQRKFDTIRPLGEAFTDDPDHLQRWAGWAAHYAAGVGLAVLYARFVYGRLPAPPPLQGVAFGMLDAAAGAWGGLYPLLHRLAPHVQLPPGYTGLSRAPELTAPNLLRHAAYGLGVGIVYRD